MALPTNSNHNRSTIRSAALLLVVLVGIAARVAYVDRPLDHRLLAPWREADYTQLARNFYREGMNIFYPRIDWRGDTPGYAEMEFPIIPWLGAWLYRSFGYHEQLLRVPALILGVLSLLVFVRLSYRVLPPAGALLASAAFAVNPLLVYLGNAMQPEPLMLLWSLIAVALIWRWEKEPRFSTLLGAAAATAAAILAKSPAVCLGLVLAYTVVRKLGRRAFRDARIYAAASVALLPPIAWYLWAAHFWSRYGMSLGVSNESHFLGWDMLLPPKFAAGILKWETLGVFTPAGWLLALAALRAPRTRVERLLVWYGAVVLFYVVTARTSADDWSFYYHSLSVAPACLLMGAGVSTFAASEGPRRSWLGGERWVGGLLAVASLVSLAAASVLLIHRRDSSNAYRNMRRCALDFARYVPADERVVVRGGVMFDEYGYPVAHNESMIFAWMDRKGFNYGDEELSMKKLAEIAARGGRYWMVRAKELKDDHSRARVEARYPRIADCRNDYLLYDLKPSPAARQSG